MTTEREDDTVLQILRSQQAAYRRLAETNRLQGQAAEDPYLMGKACAYVTWEMQDEHYGESAADAQLGDLVWHPKGALCGHVLTRTTDHDGWDQLTCECGEAEVGDHHVVILARRGEQAV